jgi:hypothetical protein
MSRPSPIERPCFHPGSVEPANRVVLDANKHVVLDANKHVVLDASKLDASVLDASQLDASSSTQTSTVQTMSFRFFRARTLTFTLAGLAG